MSDYLLSKVVAATEFPVTVEECKADLKIQHSVDDDLIESYLMAACALVGGRDGVVGKILTSETWDVKVANLGGCFDLPLSPVQSITSINYYDSENETQAFDLDGIYLYGDEDSAFIELKSGISWPAVYGRRDAFTIRFVAGFGGPDDVPENIKRAIRLIVAHWYENRTAVIVGTNAQELPMAVESLLGISRKGWSA